MSDQANEIQQKLIEFATKTAETVQTQAGQIQALSHVLLISLVSMSEQNQAFKKDFLDRIVQVQLVGRALTRKFTQSTQRDLDVAGTEFDRVVEISVFAPIPHLHRAAIARALLANAHAFGVVAIGPERRRSGRTDPLVAALVAVFLLFHALAQGFHEFLEAAERFDARPLLLAQHQLGLAPQPFFGNVVQQVAEVVLSTFEIDAEYPVEEVEL